MKKNKQLIICLHGILLFFLHANCPGSDNKQNLDSIQGQGYENSNIEEIIVVCKTHFDIGYTHRVKDLIPYYRTTMIDRAMNTMDQSESLPPEQRFIWTSPGWVMAKLLEDWSGQTAERRQRLDKAFKSGKFVTHALPFSSHTEIMHPEDYARGYQFSTYVSKKYGLPCWPRRL